MLYGRRMQWLLIGLVAILAAVKADAQSGPGIPQLMLPATAGWTTFVTPDTNPDDYVPADYLHGESSIQRAISLGAPADKVTAYLRGRTFNEWIPPPSGLGPISDGPDHPFYNNNVAQMLGRNSTYRIADLNSEAARNLMLWALLALQKQNALALAGRNGETRQARCWETGVPDFHEARSRFISSRRQRKSCSFRAGACGTSI